MAFGFVVTCVVLWSGWFIWQTSFVLGDVRYFSLFDDAMISMTYARNLVQGEGLDWSRNGVPVEGFTNPLWTASMVPANAVGLPLRFRSLLVQGQAVLVLVLLLWRVRRLAEDFFSAESGDRSFPWAALLLTASFYPLLYWTLMGMEVGLQALLLVWAVHLALEVADGRPREVHLSVVLAASYLARMDSLIAVVCVLAWLVVQRHIGPRRESPDPDKTTYKRWATAIFLFVGVVGGYQVFRLIYFGDWLPNTYYLKMAGIPLELRLGRGLEKLVDFARANSVALAVVACLLAPSIRSSRRALLPLMIALAFAAYSVWVGGDAWEMHNNMRANRFLATVAPLVFVLVNDGLARALGFLRGRASDLRLALGGAVVLLVALTLNGLWFSADAEKNWRTVAVIEPPLLVSSHVVVLRDLRRFQQHVSAGALVSTHWAGIPAFFSDYRLIDAMGYNDRHIAKLPVADDLTPGGYTPGHAKRDVHYVLSKQPDALFQVWNLPSDHPGQFLRKRGYLPCEGFWVRPESPYVHNCGLGASNDADAHPGGR